MAKKFLSALLAVLMVISMVPMAAMAEGVDETVPTLVVGLSKDPDTANADIGKALGGTASISDAEGKGNILWFGMTGLGTNNNEYRLSMTDSEGKELLGEKYVSYSGATRNFTPTGPTYFIYVTLDDPAEPGEDGKADGQVNAKVLADGQYTVKLIRAANGQEILSEQFTMTSKEVEDKLVWTGKQATDLSKIEFKGATTKFEEKNPSDYQTGTPKFAVTSAGTDAWNVNVSGVELKHITGWNEFHGTNEKERHGYYVGISIPKVLCGNVVGRMVLTGTDGEGNPVEKVYATTKGEGVLATIGNTFTEQKGTYCDIVLYLGETAEEAKAATKKVKLTYGNFGEQIYTFTFSDLKFPDETVKAEAATGTLYSDTKYSKNVSKLQNGVTAETNAETKTITVTGTAYKVTGWGAYRLLRR